MCRKNQMCKKTNKRKKKPKNKDKNKKTFLRVKRKLTKERIILNFDSWRLFKFVFFNFLNSNRLFAFSFFLRLLVHLLTHLPCYLCKCGHKSRTYLLTALQTGKCKRSVNRRGVGCCWLLTPLGSNAYVNMALYVKRLPIK